MKGYKLDLTNTGLPHYSKRENKRFIKSSFLIDTQIRRIMRIFTDKSRKIRENPSDLYHPCIY